MVSCLYHLDDFIWNLACDKLSYVDQLSLSETCQRFYNLIQTNKASKHFEELVKNIYSSQKQIQDAVKEFIRKANLYDIESSDKLYLNYFFLILKHALHPKKVAAHLFWCQRNYSFLREDCKLCSQVIRFYDNIPEIYLYAEHLSDIWEEEIPKVFDEKLYYKREGVRFTCHYFENVYTKFQLVNLFGIIAVRIFFNLSKKYIFLTQFKQKELLYEFFKGESRIIFSTVCSSVSINYVEILLKELKPNVDYDSTYLKISNTFYVKYLKKILEY